MYLFSTPISNGSSCTNWLLFPSPLSREPPRFNGTSKVRHFYFNTFKRFHRGSHSFNVCFTLRIGYLYEMSSLSQPSGEDVPPLTRSVISVRSCIIVSGLPVIDPILIPFRALATEDFKVPDKMVGFSKEPFSSLFSA